MANGAPLEGKRGGATLLTVLIVVAVLYFARAVLIPLALAMLLAFLLAPLTIRLRRWGLGRVPSALTGVVFSFAILGVLGSLMTSQLADLAHKLPGYQQNVARKMDSIRTSGGGVFNRISRVVHNITDELTPPAPAPSTQPSEERPVPVEIRRSPFSPMEIVQKLLGSLVSIAVTALIVIVFVVFILIEREDLRDRLIRLAGSRRVKVTTELLDDAARRVSRYLLAQLVVNATYGALVGVGLYFLGVPNPILWGILTALLRYIPYLGIWIAAAMPAAIAFAVDPGWLHVPLIFAMYFGVDLLMYNVVEPLLYGSSTGISPLAILVAAVFWTWLWGAVGLLLATPLTVCVVVVGRHVPNLEFLEVMLSDRPVLGPETRLYQRLLARDIDEAAELAYAFLKEHSLEELYDQVIIPALSLAEEDRHRGRLDDAQQEYIFQNTRILVEDLAERAEAVLAGNGSAKVRPSAAAKEPPARPSESEPQVICIPARDEADELASLMLAQLLKKRGVKSAALRSGLAGESLQQVSRGKSKIACVAAVPPFGYMHARYLCRRLRDQQRDLRVVGAILTEQDVDELRRREPTLAADEVASSLRQVLTLVLSLLSVRPEREATPAAGSS